MVMEGTPQMRGAPLHPSWTAVRSLVCPLYGNVREYWMNWKIWWYVFTLISRTVCGVPSVDRPQAHFPLLFKSRLTLPHRLCCAFLHSLLPVPLRYIIIMSTGGRKWWYHSHSPIASILDWFPQYTIHIYSLLGSLNWSDRGGEAVISLHLHPDRF